MKLWIVLRWHEDLSFEFVGVYDTEEAAVAACVDWTFSVNPATLNETVQDERIEWPGAYYPLAADGRSPLQRNAPPP